MTPEKKVQNSIIEYFKKLEKNGFPIMVERRQAGGFSYKMGIPDLYAVVNGFHLEIEVKRHGGQLRPMQEKYKLKCVEKNIAYVCADSVEVVENVVEKLLEKKV